MGSLVYELYDAYLAAWKAVQYDPMPEAMVQKCKLAGEVQHQFLDYGDRSQYCLNKLLGFLETDSIPVCCCLCIATSTKAVDAAAAAIALYALQPYCFPLQPSCLSCFAYFVVSLTLLFSIRISLTLPSVTMTIPSS